MAGASRVNTRANVDFSVARADDELQIQLGAATAAAAGFAAFGVAGMAAATSSGRGASIAVFTLSRAASSACTATLGLERTVGRAAAKMHAAPMTALATSPRAIDRSIGASSRKYPSTGE